MNMKYLTLLTLTFGLLLFGCSGGTKPAALAQAGTGTVKLPDDPKRKGEIQALMRQMLKWADSKNAIEVLPAFSEDSTYVGFDLDKLHQNLEKLKETGFFAEEFIDNYDRIIRTLDKKIKNNEFEKWNVGELPTFAFANDASPWCSCQDNMPWDDVEVEVVNLNGDKGELTWNWGKLSPGTDPSWKDFSYKFRVVKIDGKWKVSYLQGFDYKDSVK